MIKRQALNIFVFRVILFGLTILASYGILLRIRPSAIQWLGPTSAVFAGIYFGFVEKSETYSRSFVEFKKALGIVVIMTGVLLPFFVSKRTVLWEPYTPGKFTEAQASGQPMIMDFYAEWCVPCHELDHFTYTDPEVIRRLENYVRFKADLTHTDDPEVQAVIQRFKIPGVPVVSLIAPGGEELMDARITGFVPPNILLQYLDCAEGQWAGGPSMKDCLKQA